MEYCTKTNSKRNKNNRIPGELISTEEGTRRCELPSQTQKSKNGSIYVMTIDKT